MAPDVVAFAALAGLVGLILGVMLGLNGFAQPVGTTALSQTPRIKNIGWLFSGFFVLYVADLKRVGLRNDFPVFWPFLCYGLGAILGALLSIGWMALSIRQSVRRFQRENPLATEIDPGALVREYLTYGKVRFDETWARVRTEALEVARQRRTGFEAEADRLVAECIYSITRALDAQRRLPENDLMDAILRAVCEKTRGCGGPRVTLRPSYLAFVPYDQADDALIEKALFTAGMPGGYSGYLVLRRGSQRVSREVGPPIARIPYEALPGAPEAVVAQGPGAGEHPQHAIRPAVSKQAQADIRDFSRHPYFDQAASVASFLVVDRDTFHGVINIELNEPNLLGGDEKILQTLDARLQPMIALFSVFR